MSGFKILHDGILHDGKSYMTEKFMNLLWMINVRQCQSTFILSVKHELWAHVRYFLILKL